MMLRSSFALSLLMLFAEQLTPAPSSVAGGGFTATEWIALMAAFGILIGAVFGGIVSVVTAMKVAKIEAHVNSEKTALEERAKARDQEISILRALLSDQKSTAALLAQAASNRSRTGEHIEQNRANVFGLAPVSEPVRVEVTNTPLTTRSEPEGV